MPSGVVAQEPPIGMVTAAAGHPAKSIARSASDGLQAAIGWNPVARERLWSEACARHRLAHAPVGDGDVVVRCER
jgi:hypothetical protein